MRLRTALGTTAATLLLLGAGSAQAGEVNGKGDPIPAPLRANSICVFSGLEDGEENPDAPSGPGAPPQNWGQIPKEVRDILTEEGAQPGDSCNGHTGFLAGGGEEP